MTKTSPAGWGVDWSAWPGAGGVRADAVGAGPPVGLGDAPGPNANGTRRPVRNAFA